MPTRRAEVVTLLSEQITHLETSMSNQLRDVRLDLGERISELAARVGAQNGRVGKCETAIAAINAQHDIEPDPGERINKKHAVWIGSGGIISGAALIEIVKWLASGVPH
jgi:hypothetical protein